jgi:hypothetical protein
MRSVLIAGVAGLLAGLMAHELGLLLIVFGLVVVVLGLLLTLTAIGAVVGVPLLFLGILEIALGAVSAHGTAPAVVLGCLVGVGVYAYLQRRERRPVLRHGRS